MTPMLKQYRAIKEKVPGAILFFRLGDFYEMFFDDAEKASSLLDITLTSRDGGSSGKVPMCGVPYHAAKNYINRLTREGLKVAICEQVEDPLTAKGIVKREVVRIITPGTNLDDEELFSLQNNYIVSCTYREGLWGVSYLDLSTGVFKLTEVSNDEDLLNELGRIAPKELVIPESLRERTTLLQFIKKEHAIVVNHYEDWVFDLEESQRQLQKQFQLISLEGLGLALYSVGISAAGALLYYLKDNLHNSLAHLKRPTPYRSSEYMMVDRKTQRNLELVELLSGEKRGLTLFTILNETLTPMGARLLSQWIKQPLLSLPQIRERHEAIEGLISNPDCLRTLRVQLKSIRDMERLLGRITCGVCSARDLIAMKESLKVVPEIRGAISPFTSSLIMRQKQELFELKDLVVLIENAIVEQPPFSTKEGGLIKRGYHAGLDELRDVSRHGKQWVAHLQNQERERTGIKSLKVSFNQVFGYYIEVTKPNLSLVPDNYIRKQTLVNTERFITPDLKEMENKILGAEEKAHALEYELFEEIRQRLLTYVREIQRSADAVALLDVLISLATVAMKNNYLKPEISEDSTIVIKAGRHPVVERVLGEGQFIENDALLDQEDNQLLIITGPNMAGKSTYIRQVALTVLMAQMGSFVPAGYAHIGLIDKIFTRIGASDNLARGESTFMVEMIETANILNNASPKSLVILDEIGRGTSTYDGVSIAWAVGEFLNRSEGPRPKTLFATHFHELTELEHSLKGVKNYHITAREVGEEIVFIRKIVPGGADRSYGIHVGKLAGLPNEVVERAQEILSYLEEEKISEEALAKKLRKKGKTASLKPLPLFKDLEGEDVAQNISHKRVSRAVSEQSVRMITHPVVKELGELAIDEMTPLEALNRLQQLKEKITSSSSSGSPQGL